MVGSSSAWSGLHSPVSRPPWLAVFSHLLPHARAGRGWECPAALASFSFPVVQHTSQGLITFLPPTKGWNTEQAPNQHLQNLGGLALLRVSNYMCNSRPLEPTCKAETLPSHTEGKRPWEESAGELVLVTRKYRQGLVFTSRIQNPSSHCQTTLWSGDLKMQRPRAW